MKKFFLAICLSVVLVFNLQSQWYYRKYNETDINVLSKGQLELALNVFKNDRIVSELLAGMGGGIFILFKYSHSGYVGTIFGAGMLAVGSAAIVEYSVRISRIKLTIKKNYLSHASINISPAVMENRFKQSFHPGILLTYNF